MPSCYQRVRLSPLSASLLFSNLEETIELKARLEVLERLLGDYVPNLPNTTGLDRFNNDSVPLDEESRPKTTLANPDTMSSQGPFNSNQRGEQHKGNSGAEGALAAFAGAQTFGGGTSQTAFDMSSILDQPLIFDFNTPPQSHTQISEGQASISMAPPRAATAALPQDLGHGTLVMNKFGATKYFGRTAASEWLKNVSQRPGSILIW